MHSSGRATVYPFVIAAGQCKYIIIFKICKKFIFKRNFYRFGSHFQKPRIKKFKNDNQPRIISQEALNFALISIFKFGGRFGGGYSPPP